MRIVAPNRVAHTYTQTLNGPAEAVFALLCPVREAEWIEGWDPGLVVTASGVAELDCAFTTGSGAEAAVWVVTRYEPETHAIEFIKVTPEVTVARVAIRVRPVDERRSTAEVTYQHTALGPAGDAFVAGFTPDAYALFMRGWEARMNHFLASGSVLPNYAVEQAVGGS
jgi:hypothetical protein